MVFSSLFFIFVYLPIVLAVYFVTPLKLRNLFLLFANLIFYGFSEPIYILIMIFSIIVDYTHGILVEKYRDDDKKARYFVGQSVVINLSLLFFFKYFDFLLINLQEILPFLENIKPLGLSLPVGISFYTFQTMSYTIDIYRKQANTQKNIIDFGVFVTLFPQLIAGPIVKYKDIDTQLTKRSHTIDKFSSGINLFALGLFKKVLIANNVGQLWEIYKSPQLVEMSVLGAWLGIIAFSFQLYFDFSGYSDMARGLGKMLGFEFMENFNYPYISKSATEFWRRWHISLSTWFKEYLYIPLGGSKHGKLKTYRNIFIVWLATGIWHGAEWNFLFWGLYYALILMIEKAFLLKYLQKLPNAVSHIYAILVIIIGWTIFALEGSFLLPLEYLKTLFFISYVDIFNADALYYLKNFIVILSVATLCSIPIKVPKKIKTLSPLFVLISLVLSTAYLIDSTFNPFLYFRF